MERAQTFAHSSDPHSGALRLNVGQFLGWNSSAAIPNLYHDLIGVLPDLDEKAKLLPE